MIATAASAELAQELAKPAPGAPTTGGGRPTLYKLASGKRVPGVTTITGRFKDAGGLIHWAWDLGIQGIDYKKARDDAADVGTAAHALVDASIHGQPAPEKPAAMSQDDWLKAMLAFEAFDAWRKQVDLVVLDTERPLVSEAHRFGGTYDAVARVNGEIVLLDWKSSNSVYREYIAQVAAYRQLVQESPMGEKWPVKSAGLIRFGKEHGDFTWHSWPSSVLDLGWKAFEKMRALYELDAEMKKVVR